MRYFWLIFWLLYSGDLWAQMQITSMTATPATCSSNGTATVTISGGAPVYCYQINGGACLFSSSTTFTFTDLTPGVKNISVTDGTGAFTATATVEVPGNYSVPGLFGIPQGCGVLAQATGGLPPYQYAISLAGGAFSPLQTDPQFAPVIGNYCIRVFDACNNFTEYCGFIDISPVEFTATCCEEPTPASDICIVFTDRQGLRANDPGYWFGGQPPYTYSATANGLTVNSPNGQFQLQQLCPGWTFSITDACGNTTSQSPNCMQTEVQCLDCGAGTASIITTHGVAPYIYYYQDGAGLWQPNPAGGTSGDFTGLPVAGSGDSYIFQAIDACGNASTPLIFNCLDAQATFDCALQTVNIEPLTDFFPANITCQTCPTTPIITLTQPGIAQFLMAAGQQTFTINDACGASITIDCRDTLPDISIEKSCNTIVAKMRSNYTCDGGEMNPYTVESGVIYSLELASQPGIVLATNSTGVFENLLQGETYWVLATHPACGSAGEFVTLYTPTDFAFETAWRTTSFLVNGICQTGYQLEVSLNPAPEVQPVFTLSGAIATTDTLGNFTDILPGQWTLSADNYCLSENINLPEWKPEMSVQMPECPNGGCVQMSGALTPHEWSNWGTANGLHIISNADFYIVDCPGFNGPQCVANWGGNICNLIPGNSYSVYLKPGTFTCPVDTIQFIVDPNGTTRIDSVMATTPVACTDSSWASLTLTVAGGKSPIYAEVIDSISGQVVRTFYDLDNDHIISIDSLEALKTYLFRVVDACNNTRDASATVILLPNVLASYDRNCEGLLTLHTAAILDAHYTWRNAVGNIVSAGTGLWDLDISGVFDTSNYEVAIAFGQCNTHVTGVAVPPFLPALVDILGGDTIFCGPFSHPLQAQTGPGNYTFLWNTGVTTATLQATMPGTFTVIATNPQGCTVSDSSFIAFSATMAVDIAVSPPACFGTATGSAIATVIGGVPGYSFTWDDGDTWPIRNGLPAGQYQITVTDSLGCTQTANANISEPPPLMVTASGTPVSCFGYSDGAAQANALGGTAPYSLVWHTGDTSSSILGLIAQTYTVVGTDANGCTTAASVTIMQPDSIQLDFNIDPITCFGAGNGSIQAIATGGSGNWSYNWSAPGGQNSFINQLPSGQYTVTVTDQAQCTASGTATLISPHLLELTIVSTDISCPGGNNGSILLTAEGGVNPIIFSWNNGQSGAQLNNLTAGIYQVTATDANGCTTLAQDTLAVPPPLVVTVQPMNTSCSYSTDGSIYINVTGGTPGYQYFWGVGGPSIPLWESLAPGTYTVTITDSQNCTTSASAQIASPAPILVQYNIEPILCAGDAQGTITVGAQGGTPGYQFNWNTGIMDSTITQLTAGMYTVTVTDQNNCIKPQNIPLLAPDSLQIIGIASTDSGCGASVGTLTPNVVGGILPYTAHWSNGSNAWSIQQLPAGVFTVTITDANGCTMVAVDTVQGLLPIEVETSVLHVSCFGAADGMITIESVEGGNGGPYYMNGQLVSLGQQLTGLPAGNYTLIIGDGGICNTQLSETIYQPPFFSISLPEIVTIDLGTPITLKPDLQGSPAPPVWWQWSPAVGLSCDSCSSTTAFPFQNTFYQVTATDGNSCTATAVVQVVVDRSCPIYIANVFTPLISGPNDLLVVNAGACVKSIQKWQIFDRWGGLVFEETDFLPNDFKHAWDGTFRNRQVESGVYSWYVRYELIDGTTYLITGDVTVVY